MSIQLKSSVLAITSLITTAFLFLNCSKTHFVTVDEEALTSAGIQCTSDQVLDLSGKCINGNALAQACQLNGQLIGDGNSILTYQASSVPAGSQCVSQTRTCRSGQLSGTFTNLSCQVMPKTPATPNTPSTPIPMPPAPCYLNGTRIDSGGSILAYMAASATSCQSQRRQCTNGVLSGTYAFTSCMTLPPTAACSFNGRSLKAGETVIAYETPAATATMSCRSETRVCQSRGVLSGSFAHSSCTPYQAQPTNPTNPPTPTTPKCTPDEVLTAQRSFVQIVKVSAYDVAKSCVDDAVRTIEGSYPNTPELSLRFVNTCGNRACRDRGFISGRIAEINNEGVQLECRNDQIPATVTDSCKQRLADLPKPIEQIVMNDSTVAQLCGVSILPYEINGLINWVHTCGNRACRTQGYSTGRII